MNSPPGARPRGTSPARPCVASPTTPVSNVRPTLLRHTFVTKVIRLGADVMLMAEVAGHAPVDATRRYSLRHAPTRDAAVEAVLMQT